MIRSESVRPRFALLSSIRVDEVCVLQGTPLVGAMFAIGALSAQVAITLCALLLGSVALVAHVFVLNDWAGIDGDLQDPSRAGRTFIESGVSRAESLSLALALLALALGLFAWIGATVSALACLIAVASALYSVPASHMKGTPGLNSALHFVGGCLHFLLGYAAFAPIDAEAAAISVFFGLVFTAGHFSHEARGCDADSRNGIRTNAVVFGQRAAFVAGTILFTLAYAWLAALALGDVVPRVLLVAALVGAIHLGLSLHALRQGLTPHGMIALQRRYRVFHAALGLTMILVA